MDSTTIDCAQESEITAKVHNFCRSNGNVVIDALYAYSESIEHIETLYDWRDGTLTELGEYLIADALWQVHYTRCGENERSQVVKHLRRWLYKDRAFAYMVEHEKDLRKTVARFCNRSLRQDCWDNVIHNALCDCLSRYDATLKTSFETYFGVWLGWAIKKWRDPEEKRRAKCTQFSQLEKEETRHAFDFAVARTDTRIIDAEARVCEVFDVIREFCTPENQLILRLRLIDKVPASDLAKQFGKSMNFIVEWYNQALAEARFFTSDMDE